MRSVDEILANRHLGRELGIRPRIQAAFTIYQFGPSKLGFDVCGRPPAYGTGYTPTRSVRISEWDYYKHVR